MNRRSFFKQLASGLIIVSSDVFVPKLIKVTWKRLPSSSEYFATFVGPVIREVLMRHMTMKSLFIDTLYDQPECPSFPLDLYYGPHPMELRPDTIRL